MNFWKIGEIYLVNTARNVVMGTLIDHSDVELTFQTIDCEPTKFESTIHHDLYCGDGVVLLSRSAVTFAEKMTKQPS